MNLAGLTTPGTACFVGPLGEATCFAWFGNKFGTLWIQFLIFISLLAFFLIVIQQ
jgi:hypothetical protein